MNKMNKMNKMKKANKFKEKNLNLIFVMGIIAVVTIMMVSMSGCTNPDPGNGGGNGNGTTNMTPNQTSGEGEVVETGDTVEVDYVLTLDDGTVFDQSKPGEPLTFTIGQGQMIGGFVKAVMGMKEGETRNVTIPPEDAYGAVDLTRMASVPRLVNFSIPDFKRIISGGKEPAAGDKYTINGMELEVMEVQNITQTFTEDDKNVIFYHSASCPHCVKMEPFVKALTDEGYAFNEVYDKNPDFEAKRQEYSDVLNLNQGVPQFGCRATGEMHLGEFTNQSELKKFADKCKNASNLTRVTTIVIVRQNPTPGMILTSAGGQQVKVADVSDTTMTLDYNHPLAGKTLNFEIKLSKIMDACEVMGITKQDKPEIDMFIMSYCPYGTMIEKGIIPVHDLLGDKATINIRFVPYLMHGKQEADENTLQYCIDKEQKDKFWPYLACFLGKGNSSGCLDRVGVDKTKLRNCITSADAEFNISAELAKGAQYPRYNIHEAIASKYGQMGSPTVIINGAKVSTGRDAESLKKAICCAFNEKPPECEQTLNSTTPSPGFGYTGGGGGAAGSCG